MASRPGTDTKDYNIIAVHILCENPALYLTLAGKDRAVRVADSESDSDDDSGQVGALAPPLTEQISNILNRYPEGGQILKVEIYRLSQLTLF